MCGEGILRKYGVPIGISVIVGSHHGKTPDECSDEIEEKIENYGKDVFLDNKEASGKLYGKNGWIQHLKKWIFQCRRTSGYQYGSAGDPYGAFDHGGLDRF